MKLDQHPLTRVYVEFLCESAVCDHAIRPHEIRVIHAEWFLACWACGKITEIDLESMGVEIAENLQRVSDAMADEEGS